MTPPTQLTSQAPAFFGRSARGTRRTRVHRGQAVDDRGAFLVDHDPRNDRANDAPAVLPRQLVEPLSYAGCKVLQACDHRAQLDRFTQLLVRLLHVRLRPGNSGANGLGSRLEVLELDGPDFVGVYDALQRSLMRREGAQCFGMVRAQLIGD